MLLGVGVAIGLIGISGAVNFRMAFRTADTNLDAWLYGTAAALLDGLKALLPLAMVWAWQARRWFVTFVGVAVFSVLSGFSLVNGIGYVSDLRWLQVGQRKAGIESRASLKATMTRLEGQLAAILTTRSAETIEQAIGAVFARPVARHSTVDSHSDGCTNARSLTREACEEVARLRVELAESRERTRLNAVVAETRARLDALSAITAMASAEPQVEVVKGLAEGWYGALSKEDVRRGLVVMVGLVLELGSGLGLYLVTVPWHDAGRRNGKAGGEPAGAGGAPEVEAPPASVDSAPLNRGEGEVVERMPEAVRIGNVEAFAAECLVPAEGGRISSTSLFGQYRRWCIRRGEVPLRGSEFEVVFHDLAEDVGIPWGNRGGNVMYHDVALTLEQPPQVGVGEGAGDGSTEG
ncbi:MAG: hypothetical protein AB7E81_04645 [Hyphomicrobiaceae bacterium]